jgi:hypothetical protein
MRGEKGKKRFSGKRKIIIFAFPKRGISSVGPDF